MYFQVDEPLLPEVAELEPEEPDTESGLELPAALDEGSPPLASR